MKLVISKYQYFKDMAKAFIKGYFAGLREGKQCKKDISDTTKQELKQA